MTTTTERAPAVPRAAAAPDASWPAALVPVAVGLLAALVAGFEVARPALWRDEVATVAAATRTWPALLGMVAHVDAVHALYYAAMHVWFGLVGYSPLSLRLPSVLAVGATAAATAVLGDRLGGRRVGLAAGCVAAVLPSLVWAGGEGRSFAGTALLAVLATLALVHAIRLPRATPVRIRVLAWAGYGALLALGAAVFVDVLLLAAAHAMSVLLLRRRSFGGFALAAAAATAAVLPLVRLAAAQGGQVSWIVHYGAGRTGHQVLVEQWFRSDAVAWIVLAILVLTVVVGVVGRVRSWPSARTPGRERRALLAVAVPFAVLPTALLLAASAVHAPLYWPRYVTFTAPAVALIVGAAATALGRRAAVAAVLVLAAVAVPQIRADRQPRAKADSEIGIEAQLVASARAITPAEGRAGIVYGQYDDIAGLTTGMSALAYPADVRGLVDLTATRPIATSTDLFEPRESPSAALPRMRALHTVWFLLDLDSEPKTPIPVAGLHALGFTESGRYHAPGSLLIRWTHSG